MIKYILVVLAMLIAACSTEKLPEKKAETKDVIPVVGKAETKDVIPVASETKDVIPVASETKDATPITSETKDATPIK